MKSLGVKNMSMKLGRNMAKAKNQMGAAKPPKQGMPFGKASMPKLPSLKKGK